MRCVRGARPGSPDGGTGTLREDDRRMPDLMYVYGLVKKDFDASRLPTGIEDLAVTASDTGAFRTLVSRLPGEQYRPQAIAQNSADVAWVSPRAMAHDRVLTWAQEHGGVIPLPMFSMWGSDAAVEKSLAEQSKSLERVFERVANADEFGLRAYRRDDDAMMKAVDEVDPEFAKMRREAESMSAGRRYLQERKLADLAKDAVRRTGKKMAADIFQGLRNVAREALARPLSPVGSGAADATLLLNGAFLVERARLDEFRSAVAAVVERHEPLGLTFDFTGPWPPYNFVAESGSSALRAAKT